MTGDVEAYLGQTVSIRGDAEVAVGEASFLLQDDQLFGGQEVIVFNATGTPFLLPTADEPTEDVQVTKEVQQLVIWQQELKNPQAPSDFEPGHVSPEAAPVA